MDWVMLSGLSSRMSGLDKGGGLGLYSGDIIDPLLQARVNIGSRLGCLILLLQIAWSIMAVTDYFRSSDIDLIDYLVWDTVSGLSALMSG